MEQENSQRQNNIIFSKKVRSGRRRTYFIDVRPTRSNDYYLTLTESKKRFDGDGYERHKIFLYKEDFNKFLDALTETVDFVKTELMPEYDFDEFSHKFEDRQGEGFSKPADSKAAEAPPPTDGQPEIEEEKIVAPSDDVEEVKSDETVETTTEDDTPSDDDLKWD